MSGIHSKFRGVSNARLVHATLLWILTWLFFVRVLGQALVALFRISFLPQLDQWHSGLIPYPMLLFTQCLILALQVKINVDLLKGKGFFLTPRERMGVFLCRFSYFYSATMALRYVVTMALYPDLRWSGGAIPIFFHFVLAGYLYVWGRFQATLQRFTKAET